RSSLGVPFLVWIFSVLWCASAAHFLGLSATSAQTWARWDSYQYTSIATDGYKVWREPRMGQGQMVEWNGNTAWFPLYPGFIRLLHRTGLTPEGAGKVLAEAFWFLTLALLWNLYLRRKSSGVLLLILAAFFPGSI